MLLKLTKNLGEYARPRGSDELLELRLPLSSGSLRDIEDDDWRVANLESSAEIVVFNYSALAVGRGRGERRSRWPDRNYPKSSAKG